jgi:hypothetical protein
MKFIVFLIMIVLAMATAVAGFDGGRAHIEHGVASVIFVFLGLAFAALLDNRQNCRRGPK